VVYVVDQGVVKRMEARDARHLKVMSSHVGEEVKKVCQAYGSRLSVRLHAHFERGPLLAVYSPHRQFARAMESNGTGCVVTLRGGMVPAVESLEGCCG